MNPTEILQAIPHEITVDTWAVILGVLILAVWLITDIVNHIKILRAQKLAMGHHKNVVDM